MNEEQLKLYNTENFKAQFRRESETREGGGEQGNTSGSYEFIAKLLLHPVEDGRHRLLWLVLAPYAVSVLKLNRENAILLVTAYLEECNKLNPCYDVLSTIEQYVDYAASIDLRPPKLETIRDSDPDMAEIIEGAIA